MPFFQRESRGQLLCIGRFDPLFFNFRPEDLPEKCAAVLRDPGASMCHSNLASAIDRFLLQGFVRIELLAKLASPFAWVSNCAEVGHEYARLSGAIGGYFELELPRGWRTLSGRVEVPVCAPPLRACAARPARRIWMPWYNCDTMLEAPKAQGSQSCAMASIAISTPRSGRARSGRLPVVRQLFRVCDRQVTGSCASFRASGDHRSLAGLAHRRIVWEHCTHRESSSACLMADTF